MADEIHGDVPSGLVPLNKEELLPELVNSISDQIFPFVVGLLHADDLIGSGTLVRFGDRFGILTAHHVIHEARPKLEFHAGSQDTLGLIILTERAHRFEMPLGVGLLSIIDIAKPSRDDWGPDLAFIEIKPSKKLEELTARRDFFYVDSNRDKVRDRGLNEFTPMAIAGFQHEGFVLEKDIDGFAEVKGFKGWTGLTRLDKQYRRDQFDYGDAVVQYSEELDLPKSFGGFSGGGLWTFEIMKDAESGKLSHSRPLLVGVIYYQKNISEERKALRCHLNRSIYDYAFNVLRS